MEFIIIENTSVFTPDQYSISVSDKLTDSSAETEAGTKQYDFVKKDVHVINLKVVASGKWSKLFATWRSKDMVKVKFVNEYSMMNKEVFMRFTEYSTEFIIDIKHKRIQQISMSLEEIDDTDK